MGLLHKHDWPFLLIQSACNERQVSGKIIGGVVRQGDSHWRQLLVRLYQFLIRKRGYVDHIDLSLEPMTVSWAKDHFEQVNTVDSGEHWRLIIARGLRQA